MKKTNLKPVSNNVYELEVFLTQGPVSETFLKKNKSISRTIEILGHHTLENLHEIIFEAFDREDPHMYEFQFGKGPHDPKGMRAVLPDALERKKPSSMVDVTKTTIDSLDLNKCSSFGYWFDFGDDWYHQINVVAIKETVGKGKYPTITKRFGESPPQYS